jgi:cellulose biosynthesis protein BcsQ
MNTKPPILTFFNNNGGVGKTSLVYHLAYMYADQRKRVLTVDLDPQSNLTAAFLDEDKIEQIWNNQQSGTTIFNCVKPLTGVKDIAIPELEKIANDLYLIPGDVELSRFEETLSGEWPKSMMNDNLYRPMRILSSFWQVIQMGAKKIDADIILVDIGPNLGAINRSVLVATDYVVIPLGADLFSLQGLKNLGPTLRNWTSLWGKCLKNWSVSPEFGDNPDFELPEGQVKPIGYVCQQHGVRLDRPVRAYEKWVNRIPEVYRTAVLDQPLDSEYRLTDDPECLSTIKHYRSLIPMGQEHRKPIFMLTPADGAIGSHANAVKDAKNDFKELATKIAAKMGVVL